jgi:hypothetical protein
MQGEIFKGLDCYYFVRQEQIPHYELLSKRESELFCFNLKNRKFYETKNVENWIQNFKD